MTTLKLYISYEIYPNLSNTGSFTKNHDLYTITTKKVGFIFFKKYDWDSIIKSVMEAISKKYKTPKENVVIISLSVLPN